MPPCIHEMDFKVVLEADGTEVDDEEIFEEFSKEILLLLQPGEVWISSSTDPVPYAYLNPCNMDPYNMDPDKEASPNGGNLEASKTSTAVTDCTEAPCTETASTARK